MVTAVVIVVCSVVQDAKSVLVGKDDVMALVITETGTWTVVGSTESALVSVNLKKRQSDVAYRRR